MSKIRYLHISGVNNLKVKKDNQFTYDEDIYKIYIIEGRAKRDFCRNTFKHEPTC